MRSVWPPQRCTTSKRPLKQGCSSRSRWWPGSVENRAQYQERQAREGEHNGPPAWRGHRSRILSTATVWGGTVHCLTSVATGSVMARKPSVVLPGHPLAGETEAAIPLCAAADDATRRRPRGSPGQTRKASAHVGTDRNHQIWVTSTKHLHTITTNNKEGARLASILSPKDSPLYAFRGWDNNETHCATRVSAQCLVI